VNKAYSGYQYLHEHSQGHIDQASHSGFGIGGFDGGFLFVFATRVSAGFGQPVMGVLVTAQHHHHRRV
jgi:hypothetical protein